MAFKSFLGISESTVQKYKGHVASLREVFKSTKVMLQLRAVLKSTKVMLCMYGFMALLKQKRVDEMISPLFAGPLLLHS